MKLKKKPGDFRVRELLREDFVQRKGAHRVYRVRKRKITSLEAASTLASLAGVRPADVSMAGLKDRQGITEQTMTIPRGKPVIHRDNELSIETIGSSAHAISSDDTLGNHFDIVVRDVGPLEERHVKGALPVVRDHGLPNYFDEQRFGNLRHGQGWIALDLAHGRYEVGLKRLLTAVSRFDDGKMRGFKSALYRHWGDWRTCRDIAGRFGAHHSVFEHLKREGADFAGAFGFVSSRIRLIHLYAYQSHVWNRVLARAIEADMPRARTLGIGSVEGRLVFPKGAFSGPPEWRGVLPLPGQGLEGVELADQRALFAEVLERDELTPERFRIDDVPGFLFKHEDRPVTVVPRELRIKRPESDPRGRTALELSFGLPRGSYATLVVRRLLGSSARGAGDSDAGPSAGRSGFGRSRSEPRAGQPRAGQTWQDKARPGQRGGARRGSTRGARDGHGGKNSSNGGARPPRPK